MSRSREKNQDRIDTSEYPEDLPVMVQTRGNYMMRSAHLPDGRGDVICGGHQVNVDKLEEWTLGEAHDYQVSLCGNCLRIFLGIDPQESVWGDTPKNKQTNGYGSPQEVIQQNLGKDPDEFDWA